MSPSIYLHWSGIFVHMSYHQIKENFWIPRCKAATLNDYPGSEHICKNVKAEGEQVKMKWHDDHRKVFIEEQSASKQS